jgi:hypothetical protein
MKNNNLFLVSVIAIILLFFGSCYCQTYTISGYVTYDNVAKTPIISTIVELDNSQNQKLDSTFTVNAGEYMFKNLSNGTYKLVCKRTIMKWGGVNPLDAMAINKYYLGIIKTFGGDNALRKRAADVNNDNKITPLDAMMINRRFIGIIKRFNIPDWLFGPTTATVTISGSSIFQDFKAICAGDVNGSYPK